MCGIDPEKAREYDGVDFLRKVKTMFNMFANNFEAGRYHSLFSEIYHEMGHLQHVTNANSSFSALDKKYEKLFEQSKKTAKKVSEYASTSPCEFVAECYAKMADGIKLDDDIINLYKKLGGVMI